MRFGEVYLPCSLSFLVYVRDLKSENVLVWTFPTPTQLEGPVRVKLADYGISRAALPTGTKGFGGKFYLKAPYCNASCGSCDSRSNASR